MFLTKMDLASLLNHISVGGRVCRGLIWSPNIWGPSLLGVEFVRGRVCQGPSLLGAEMSRNRLETPFKSHNVKATIETSNCENYVLYFSEKVQKIAAIAMVFLAFIDQKIACK